jgi:hypothetical protein
LILSLSLTPDVDGFNHDERWVERLEARELPTGMIKEAATGLGLGFGIATGEGEGRGWEGEFLIYVSSIKDEGRGCWRIGGVAGSGSVMAR